MANQTNSIAVIDKLYMDIVDLWNKSESISATMIFIFVVIDTLGYLSMPLTKVENKKIDFTNWVESYLKAESTQPYQYNATDLYAARCAKLHAFSAKSADAKKKNCIIFGYHGGVGHTFNSLINPDLVILSVPTLIDDLSRAVTLFMEQIKSDSELKKRVNSRIDHLYAQFDIVQL